MAGFKGLPPRATVIRQNETPALTVRVRELLLDRTIVDIDFDENTLTLHLDNGSTFSMNNYGGFTETS